MKVFKKVCAVAILMVIMIALFSSCQGLNSGKKPLLKLYFGMWKQDGFPEFEIKKVFDWKVITTTFLVSGKNGFEVEPAEKQDAELSIITILKVENDSALFRFEQKSKLDLGPWDVRLPIKKRTTGRGRNRKTILELRDQDFEENPIFLKKIAEMCEEIKRKW